MFFLILFLFVVLRREIIEKEFPSFTPLFYTNTAKMGASQSYDHGRLKAASTCVPSRFKIVSQRVNEKVV